jgi:hypothetical protein
MSNRTKEEINFLNKKGIDISKLKTRWEWVYIKPVLTLDFYNEILYSRHDRVPTKEEIDEMGYRGFRNAIKQIGKTLNELIIECGYTPNFELKYNKMNFQELVEFFLNEIIPDLLNQEFLKQNQTPSLEDLNNAGYRGFIDRIYKLNKSYNELLCTINLAPNKVFQYRGKSYQDLLDIYDSEIYPNLKKKYYFNDNEYPTKEQIQEDYSGFLQKLYKQGNSYIDLVKEKGYRPNYEFLYKDKNYSELLEYFYNEIQPTLQEIYDFPSDAAPSYGEVEKHYRGFLAALGRLDKKFSEIIKDSGLSQRAFEDLGKATHKALNLLLSQFINQEKLSFNYYTEVELFYPSSKHRIDGVFIVNPKLVNYIMPNINRIIKEIPLDEKRRNLISGFIDRVFRCNYLLIDFSNGYFRRGDINTELIGCKMQKYLDFCNSFLLLIGVNWEGDDLIQSLPFSVKNKCMNLSTKKVALINLSFLCELLNFDNETKNLLAEITLYNNLEDIENLKRLINRLDRNPNLKIFSTKEFFNYLQKTRLDKWM